MSRSSLSTILLLLTTSFSLVAQSGNVRQDKPPRLVVQLVCGSLGADAVNQYWESLSSKGIARLINYGTYCQNACYDHLVCDAPSGISTIVTGANPSEHGIVGRKWYSHVTGREEYCTRSTAVRTIGLKTTEGGYSPDQLLCGTLSESWRVAFPSSRIYAMSLDPDAAVLLAGRRADAAIWFDVTRGVFATSSYYLSLLPSWVEEYNKLLMTSDITGSQWTPYRDLSSYHSPQIESSLNAKSRFLEAKVLGGRYNRLMHVPMGENMLKDLAVSAITAAKLGEDETPDLLSIYFSTLEKVVAIYGVESPQSEDALIRLDALVAELLDYLDAKVGERKYLILFTSAMSPSNSPEYLARQEIPSGWYVPARTSYLLESYLAAVFHLRGLVLGQNGAQIYLNEIATERQGVALSEVALRAAQFLSNTKGVQRVLTSEAILSGGGCDEYMRRALAGYNPKRSGHLSVILSPGWAIESTVSTSAKGSDMSFSNRVPLIFYGWKLPAKRLSRRISMRDAVTTLCQLMHISPPNAAYGSAISELVDWDQ